MKNLIFEVHTYAPELNKVFCRGIDISRLFTNQLQKLSKDYANNLSIIRKTLALSKTTEFLRMYKVVAIRPSGAKETRFCAKYTIPEIIEQWQQAKAYYNIPGTTIKLTRYFKI